ncbi:hypothetical protein GWE18_15020 [Bradyrhizobium sp. CSA112]|nr:hypothetical protein [Bradyrhizobium sp. CSA112]
MAEPKPKKSAIKRRGRQPREELVDYIVAIEGWDWRYSLSLNMERQAIDPYHEFRHLHIRGRLLNPKDLKSDQIEVTLLPSRDLDPEGRKQFTPFGVGSLDGYGDPVTGLVSIPQDALLPILQMMIGERFKFMAMRGTKFSRRRATLHGFRLEVKIDQDDLPEGVELPG